VDCRIHRAGLQWPTENFDGETARVTVTDVESASGKRSRVAPVEREVFTDCG
jgi:hypothetical protein